MRQIGQAAQLYEETCGVHPLGTRQLVQTKLIPPSICFSPLDKTPKGMANQLVQEAARGSRDYLGRSEPYRSSFISLDTLRYTLDRQGKEFDGHPAAGWLVSLTESTPDYSGEVTGGHEGRYRRLLMDGSVVSRVHQDPYDVGGGGAKLFYGAYIAWFMDVDGEWIRRRATR